ncbi:hypothetical protein MLD38_004424 [Melastoma candidum]|uniref:Uncharacterized protein n=1 Tax=Melastoma candidum TaxID=119954 RepID=A0ACB9S6G3_9MYRT|nr:hypothetical protein MLD38_004424 [Melastoma candidum]
MADGDFSSLELTISVPGFSPPPAIGVKGLDINRVPAGGGWTEEARWMALASGSGGITTMDAAAEDEEEEEEGEGEGEDQGESNGGGPPRKKLRLSKEQSLLLEDSFRQNHTLNPKQKEALAAQLKLKPRQVEVWFQNRRARSKSKQTEIECEYLRRCFGSLTEQNRRLLREVEELRALKVGPPAVLSLHSRDPMPPSSNSLTMCPHCERVTSTNPSSTNVTPQIVKPGAQNPSVPAQVTSGAAC